MFFAYLRSLSPEPGKTKGLLNLPRSLQQLVDTTDYPPLHALICSEATKVVMIVDVVSPTPYALLRRAKNFEYRDDDRALQQFASYDDPVEALTDECKRVLKSISSTNQSNVSNSRTSTSLSDPSWSRFEDIGFNSTIDDDNEDGDSLFGRRPAGHSGFQSSPRSEHAAHFGRPTTPSWADFLSSGFADENGKKSTTPLLLPPDKMLPLVSMAPRGQSSQSHRRNLNDHTHLEPGELASIAKVEVDDAFWWVWISSLAGEEPTSRKAVFGRCALIETVLRDGTWMIMEEQVKGAAPEPVAGAYIAEKKTFLGFTTKRGRLTRRKSGVKKSPLSPEPYAGDTFEPSNRATLGPDQQAKIQQAAADLSRKRQQEETAAAATSRRGRMDEISASKTNSIFTLGPIIKDEVSPALQWANSYDKKAVRAQYLGDVLAGKGSKEMLTLPTNGLGLNRSTSTLSSSGRTNKDLPPPPIYEQRRHSDTPSPALVVTPNREAPLTPNQAVSVEVVEPAPLPFAPEIYVEPEVENEVTEEAVDVPLPQISPVQEVSEPVTPLPQDDSSAPFSRPETIPESGSAQPPPPRAPSQASPAIAARQSVEPTSSEHKKFRRKDQGAPPANQKSLGIRRLFGTKRSKSRESTSFPRVQGSPDSPVDANPAVAAARRALEGKAPANSHLNSSPPLSPNHFNKLRNASGSIAAVQTTVIEPPRPISPPMNRASTPEPARQPEAEAEDDARPVPTRTWRNEEFDQLSRVDTGEREHADKEFSTFDQGPLVDQPAFVPPGSPRPEEFVTPAEEQPPPRFNNQSVYSAVTMPPADSDDEDGSALTQQVSPQDRWAQIRRNAAERANGRPSEDVQSRRTETRTDDGDTSGEESKEILVHIVADTNRDIAIESRVARIKARVAELTGNMEQARR